MNYTAFSLVDISNTNVNRTNDTLKFNQQQNLNTLIQSIGLRSQPIQPIVSVLMTQDIANYDFGKRYQGLHTVWRLDFSSEHNKVYKDFSDEFYYLNNDCDGVAIYTNLEETAEIKSKVFETINSKFINLYFKHNTSAG